MMMMMLAPSLIIIVWIEKEGHIQGCRIEFLKLGTVDT
jgi:hypothetical protein